VAQDAFRVEVCGLIERELDLQYSDFTSGNLGPHLDVNPIVPAFTGKATFISSLLEIIQPLAECTHAVFHARDDFQAVLPKEQLKDALLLFQQEDGTPLKKGFPVRLIVPNGHSDCLNVKSVVKIEFVKLKPDQEASFGFKNTVSLEEL
jgi:DMSO/TMAO reductase YedYZ molybdopterin-dependent catalytic subunit